MKRLAWVLWAFLIGCDSKPSYDPGDIARAKLLDGLDRHFLLGASTAAHQIEGGLSNDWTEWEKGSFADGRPHIRDQSTTVRAADSWNRWREDLAALKQLGANAYRLGIEWARLQPAPFAELDAAAVARYREMLSALRAEGIEPVVTLHHFTLPLWAGQPGMAFGWDSDATPEQLGDFAAKAGKAFGDLVDTWITVNEPNVLAVNGWLRGEFAPGKKDDAPGMAHAFLRVMQAHARAAAALRASDTVDADGDGAATRIGIAHHVRVFEPASASPLDSEVAGLTDDFFNAGVPEALKSGRVRVWVPGAVDLDEAVPGLAGSTDFLGINYYTRDFVRADLSQPSLSIQYTPKDRPKNSLGWDIFPEGLERSLLRFARYGWPLMVTENGVASDDEGLHAFYLRAHLYALDRARARGAKLIGYLHWSLIDNFEWAEGYTARFGLFSVEGLGSADGSLRRLPRAAAVSVFQEAGRNIGLSPR